MNQAESPGNQQRSSTALKSKLPAIGMDLGGTKLAAAAILDLKVVSEAHTVPTPKGADNIVNAVVELIESFKKDYTFSAVGIATAGIVNCNTGEVIGSTGNLPGWTGTPLKQLIETKTMLPVFVDNDANAAAYGDALAMGLGDAVCVIGVTLGTGIGTGIVINGKPYRGSNWGAGECGHIRINLQNTRLCTCGKYDCWEAYGAGRGLVATCVELLEEAKPGDSVLAKDPKGVNSHLITSAAANGDAIALKAMHMYHEHVALGLVNLANTFAPECFVISGGMSKVVDFPLLNVLVKERALPRNADKLKIVKSSLGDFAGIVGAAQCALDSIGTAASTT
ncbi:MAG TPA: ROK family protein [Trichormus sp.]|jgi:glucokinase